MCLFASRVRLCLWRLTLIGMFAIMLSSVALAQNYGELLDGAWKKTLGISEGDNDYHWFGYPVDNFGVLTVYMPASNGKNLRDVDRLCATWSCIGLKDPAAWPKDDDHWLSANGYVSEGCGPAPVLTQDQQKKLTVSVLIPNLLSMLNLSGKANVNKHVQIRLTADALCKRSVDRDTFGKYIDSPDNKNATLKAVFDSGTLIYVGADVVVRNLKVNFIVDQQKNADASAALSQAASMLKGASASAQLDDQASGTYTLTAPKFLVLAVQTKAQWKPGMLFGAVNEGDAQTRDMQNSTRLLPRPSIDAKTLEPVK